MNQQVATMRRRPPGSGLPGEKRKVYRADKAPLTAWKSSLDPVRIGLVGTMVINISAVQMYIPGLSALRPALLCLAAAFLGLALKPKLGSWDNLDEWPVKAVFALLVLACMSAFFGISLGGAGRYIFNIYSRNLLFFFLLVLAIRNVGDLAVLVWSFVLASGIFIFLANTILGYDVSANTGETRLSGGLGIFDANDIAMIMLMAMPLAILCFRNSALTGKIISGAIALGVPMTVAMTGSRGGLIGLIALAIPLFLALSHINVFKRVIFLGAVTGMLFAGAPPGYWERMETLLNPSEDKNVTDDYGRLPIAKRGMGYMFRYPFFGIGVMNFAMAEVTISPIIQERQRLNLSVQWIAPHNTYVEVGAEMGMFALAIWLTLIGAGIFGLLRLRSKIPKEWEKQSSQRRFLRQACLWLPLTFWAFAIPSFFLSHAYTMVFYIPVAFMVGLHICVRREMEADGLIAPGGRKGRGQKNGRRPPRRRVHAPRPAAPAGTP